MNSKRNDVTVQIVPKTIFLFLHVCQKLFNVLLIMESQGSSKGISSLKKLWNMIDDSPTTTNMDNKVDWIGVVQPN